MPQRSEKMTCAPPIAQIWNSQYVQFHIYDMYYYVIHKVAHLLKTAYCEPARTGMVLYVKLVISLDEKAGLTYLTV